MKTILISIVLIIHSFAASSQIIHLKFTALFNGNHVNLDSVSVFNLTQAGDTVIHWPDTSLVLGYVGLEDHNPGIPEEFGLMLISDNSNQINPQVQIMVPARGMVDVLIADVTGRIWQQKAFQVNAGSHLFSYSPVVKGVILFSARWKSQSKSVKIINFLNENGNNELVYHGELTGNVSSREIKSTNTFYYSTGDSLRITGWHNGGYTTLNAAPTSSSNYSFFFGMNYPCPGLSSFDYGGQTYHTVQIGTQCWMRENLNVGTFVNSTNTGITHSDCGNNGIIEKYCFDNDLGNCFEYGGLYDWDELMQYSTVMGGQGICPSGWHIPTDMDWCSLTTYLDATVDCNLDGWSGSNAGLKLKEPDTLHWTAPNFGATNQSGFTALGTSLRDEDGSFDTPKDGGVFWSSSEFNTDNAWCRGLYFDKIGVYRTNYSKKAGFSVRCIQD